MATLFRIGMVVLFVVVCCFSQVAVGDLVVATAIDNNVVEGPFVAGQLVSVPFYLSGAGATVLGAEIELSVADETLRLANVEVNPALTVEFGPQVNTFPAAQCHLVRLQPVAEVDAEFGCGEQNIMLVQAQVEVLSPTFSEAGIHYKVRCLTSPEPAPQDRPVQKGVSYTFEGHVTLDNTPPWLEESDWLDVEVRPVGESEAVTELTAGSAYDVYCRAPLDWGEDYVAFFVSPDPQRGVSGAVAAGSGPWADNGVLFISSGGSPGGDTYPLGFARQWMVTSLESNPLTPPDQHGNPAPLVDQHLFTFTAGNACGPFLMEVHLWYLDHETRSSLNRECALELTVKAD